VPLRLQLSGPMASTNSPPRPKVTMNEGHACTRNRRRNYLQSEQASLVDADQWRGFHSFVDVCAPAGRILSTPATSVHRPSLRFLRSSKTLPLSSRLAAFVVTVSPAWHFLSFVSTLLRCCFFGDAHLLVYPCVTERKRVSSASSRCRVA
jgi:hypothetical protein